MKLCYALRRGVFYPSQQDLFGTMPPKEHRPAHTRNGHRGRSMRRSPNAPAASVGMP